jgi:hypothetical protein
MKIAGQAVRRRISIIKLTDSKCNNQRQEQNDKFHAAEKARQSKAIVLTQTMASREMPGFRTADERFNSYLRLKEVRMADGPDVEKGHTKATRICPCLDVIDLPRPTSSRPFTRQM